MYYRAPYNLHLELTDKCNARCPMCKRTNPDGLGDSDLVQDLELSLDLIYKRFADYKFDRVNYCGNLGDPVIARDMLPIATFMSARSERQIIHTNGSLRNESWWQTLAAIPNLQVVFGIDGVDQSTHEFYRRGTSLEKILANATAFIAAGGDATWQFIVFDHNQHQVEQAQEISTHHGFRAFEILQTRRFAFSDTFEYTYKNVPYILKKPSTSEVHLDFGELGDIRCAAKRNEEIFISADGQVWPCCYVAGDNNRIERDPVNYDLWTRELSDIIGEPYFDDVESSFTAAPMLACIGTCGMGYKNHRQRIINIKPIV